MSRRKDFWLVTFFDSNNIVHGCGRGRIKPLYRKASFSERNSYRSTAGFLLSPLNLFISTSKKEFKKREISDHRPRRLGRLWIASPVANSYVVISYDCGRLRKQPTIHDAPLFFPRNDVWERRAKIPYWWRISTQIWVVLLIGWGKCSTWQDQSKALPRSL